MSHDKLDVALEDVELLAEVELTTNLIVAASYAAEHLSPTDVDRLLGLGPAAARSTPRVPQQALPPAGYDES